MANNRIFMNIASDGETKLPPSLTFYKPTHMTMKKAKTSHGSFAVRRSKTSSGAVSKPSVPIVPKLMPKVDSTKKSVKFDLSSSPVVVVHDSRKEIPKFQSSNSNPNNKPTFSFGKSNFGSSNNRQSSFSKNKSNFSNNVNQKSSIGSRFIPSKNRSFGSAKTSSENSEQQTTVQNDSPDKIAKPSFGRGNSLGRSQVVGTESQQNDGNRKPFGSNPKSQATDTQEKSEKMNQGQMSSLFKGNPDIPLIERKEVIPRTQEVFSRETFSTLNINKILLSHMEKLHFKSLTMVQQMAIPHILKGRDVLIKSQTGSGKTLTYCLPIINSLANITPRVDRTHGVLGLIVVPTRELAIQTFELLTDICKACVFIVPGFLIGGEKKKSEKNRLRRGMNILVATPGRLVDHMITTQCLKLENVKFLVLDEADRMLEMGYEKKIALITETLREAKMYGDEYRHRNTNDRKRVLEVSSNKRKMREEDSIESVKMQKLDLNNVNDGSDSDDEVPLDDIDSDGETSGKKNCFISIKTTTGDAMGTEGKKETSFQTIMLSATLSQKVQSFAGLSLTNPEIISVSSDDASMDCDAVIIPNSLTHHYCIVPPKQRMVVLAAFILDKCLLRGAKGKMLVFMPSQDMVDYYTALFQKVLARYGKIDEEEEETPKDELETEAADIFNNMEVGPGSKIKKEPEDFSALIDIMQLHGNMNQQERTAVFNLFKKSMSGVLLCTDVGARGLDLANVNWIVQYNAPATVTDYVHRVGRTSRADTSGDAIIMLAPSEVKYIERLEEQRITLKEIYVDSILDCLTVPPPGMDPGFRVPRNLQQGATTLQDNCERLLTTDTELFKQAKVAYISFIGAYTSYPNAVRDIFNFKSLHLGHYAKSFCLREAPSAMGAAAAFRAQCIHRSKKERRNRVEKAKFNAVLAQKKGGVPRSSKVSEFDSGLEGLGKLLSKQKQKNNNEKVHKKSVYNKKNGLDGKKVVSKKKGLVKAK